MNREEALRAFEELSASPASKWIGNRIVGATWLQKCTRCGVEETLVLPRDVHGPEDVPAGFDEKMFRWKRAFQVAHEGCVETTPVVLLEQGPDVTAKPPAEQRPGPGADVTLKRFLQCGAHGSRRWQGHVMCDACGRIYQTADARKPRAAPEVCRCGQRLMPPEAERVGDVLGLQTGGIAIDAEGRRYQTPEAQDWTARPICYLCYRHFVKHQGGRVPVERTRN